MRWIVLLAVTLGGCHLVFKLDDSDGAINDAPVDVAAEHDEDMDGAPDSADNCPGQGNANQADGDEDGVGDNCDAAPGTGPDTVLFAKSEFFAIDLGGASPSGTGFIAIGDAAETSGADIEAIDATLQFVLADSDRTGFSIEVGFTITDFGLQGNQNRFAIDVVTTSSSSIRCLFNEDSPASPASFGQLEHENGTTNFDPELDIAANVPQRMVIHSHVLNGVDCLLGTSTAHGDGDGDGDVTLTIHVERMRARINYVVLYDTTRP